MASYKKDFRCASEFLCLDRNFQRSAESSIGVSSRIYNSNDSVGLFLMLNEIF